MTRVALTAAFVLALGVENPATAEGSRPTCAPAGASGDLNGMLRLEAALDADRRSARWWNWGWTGLGVAAVAGYGALGAFSERDDSDPDAPHDRAFYWIAGARTAITVAGHALGRIEVPELPRLADGCIDAARAEEILGQVATTERKRRSIRQRVAVYSLAVLSFGVLGFGYDEWTRGALSMASAMLTTEVVIWTEPRRALELAAERAAAPTGLSVFVSPVPGGLSLAGTF